MTDCLLIIFQFSQKLLYLSLKTKNFHFTDSKVLRSCQKRVSVLTGWALVSVVKAYGAVIGIWCIGNTKIMATSKYRPITAMGKDSISFCSSSQWHLCWWQTARVDKAEQE